VRVNRCAGRRVLVCDVRGVEADVGTVDALARLQLAARRLGLEISLAGVSRDLRQLIDLCGLAEALPDAATPRAAEAARTAERATRC
jgi:ABC-type transporter Mla MlaB component